MILVVRNLADAKLAWALGQVVDITALSASERQELEDWVGSVWRSTPKKSASIW